MIDEYNAGSRKVEIFFADLVEFAQELIIEEDRRAIYEKVAEEELTSFDQTRYYFNRERKAGNQESSKGTFGTGDSKARQQLKWRSRKL